VAVIDRNALARLIDHTLLAPEATPDAIESLCAEGVELGVGAVCVSPTMVPVAVAALPPGFTVASVVGFPSGAHDAAVKSREADLVVAHGAREVDMVVNLAAVIVGDWRNVVAEVAGVRRAVGDDVIVKVIIESAALDDVHIVGACTSAVEASADFVKTSTGYHKSGGATTHAVRLMRDTVGPAVGVKASGGVRTLDDAMQMIGAGASRLGTSSARAILSQAAQTNPAANS
jgi:deoxyribose-phosphate aldolase